MRTVAAVAVIAWLKANLWAGNLVAGLAVGAYLIPQAMAYGQLAGVGVALGLGVAAIPLVIYPLIGRGRWLSMGPESAVALMAATTAAEVSRQTGLNPALVLPALALASGAILLIAWAARAGALTDLLSKPVLVGYLSGVAVLMVVSQVGNLTGTEVDSDTIVTVFASLPWKEIDWYAVAVGVGVIAVVYLVRAINKKVPGILVAMVASIPAGYLLPVAVVGPVAMSLPTPEMPGWSMDALTPILLGAAAIAVVAYTDVMVTARAFSGPDPVDASRELAALGTSQAVVGVFGGYPVSASSSRTAIAKESGAKTRFYSWIVAAVAIGAPFIFGEFLANIPKAALAGVVIVAAVGLVDLRGWKELARLRWNEVGVGLACAIGVVMLGILPGVGIAIALSVAELLIRLSRPHDAILGVVPGLPGMHDVDDYPHAATIEGLVVFRYDAPLFFANAQDFYNAALEAADTPGCKWLILNMESNVELDSTALDALLDLNRALKEEGKHLALARVKNDVWGPLKKYGVIDAVGEQNVYPTLPVAVEAYENWVKSGQVVNPARSVDEVSPVHRFARSARKRAAKTPPGTLGTQPE